MTRSMMIDDDETKPRPTIGQGEWLETQQKLNRALSLAQLSKPYGLGGETAWEYQVL